ncbi:hypothetical protein J7E99_28485 [Streptomyces sp. ISL-44]|uniref:hypothetical protein n=1 Tax=Streptomyces sp. ISL-44 TaxID=2819184 RepID=UPI001BEA5E03|nr:hypothetical protein [Streptomyces sp. ISL-44]MBT2544531.1 hypothetical protein [Streptomyces sp. ISL-44]
MTAAAMRAEHYRQAAAELDAWEPKDPWGVDFYTGLGVDEAVKILRARADELEGGTE